MATYRKLDNGVYEINIFDDIDFQWAMSLPGKGNIIYDLRPKEKMFTLSGYGYKLGLSEEAKRMEPKKEELNMENNEQIKRWMDIPKKFENVLNEINEWQKNAQKRIEERQNSVDKGIWHKTIDLWPEEERTLLVSWKDSDDNWQGPYFAYYSKDEAAFFARDCINALPIAFEIWCYPPSFPE